MDKRIQRILSLFDEYCMGDKGKRKWIADDSMPPGIHYVSDKPSRYSFSPEPDICQVTSGIGCDQVTLGQILECVPEMVEIIEHLLARNEWQDISTAPKDGIKFLAVFEDIYEDGRKQVGVSYWSDIREEWQTPSSHWALILWLPFPDVPSCQ